MQLKAVLTSLWRTLCCVLRRESATPNYCFEVLFLLWFSFFIVASFASQIKKIRSQKPHEKSAAREAALREVKERNKKAKAAKVAAAKAVAKAPAAAGKQKGAKGAKQGSVGR
jgi:hypothetical protein